MVKEEPNNPPKESMQKIGSIIITIEPHVLEATMFGIKDNIKSAAPTTNSTFRPIIQYGPPNGAMPPPPKPATPATPSAPPALPASPSPHPAPAPAPQGGLARPSAQVPPASNPTHAQLHHIETQHMPPSSMASNQPSAASPHAARSSVLAAPAGSQVPPNSHTPSRSPAPYAPQNQPLASPVGISSQAGGPKPPQAPSPSPTTSAPPTAARTPKTSTPSAKSATPAAAGADPIIVTLAEKASHDPHLRDLMKRVAIGQAAPDELAHFQRIIDQITAEYKKNGGQQGPSADRLIVDGRTVKYFSEEVRAILDIVLSSNPQQKASDLKVPSDSDPLVILLVKKSLEDHTTRNMVRRVAKNEANFSDATDLKGVLDRLKDQLPKGGAGSQPAPPHATNAPGPVTSSAQVRKTSVSHASPAATSQQALRSKGPPPNFKTEFSGLVLEFPGGTGDRYLFPKYSMLEYQPGASQVLASFLLVRKGSKSEYGGDPTLDYYQPMTIRISSPSGKHLEQIARVVAPQDEVKRYMDDIMDNMTRAEYILLAMRLPRPDKEDQAEGQSQTQTPKAEIQQPQTQSQQTVLWAAKPAPPAKVAPQPVAKMVTEDEQYQSFIATVS